VVFTETPSSKSRIPKPKNSPQTPLTCIYLYDYLRLPTSEGVEEPTPSDQRNAKNSLKGECGGHPRTPKTPPFETVQTNNLIPKLMIYSPAPRINYSVTTWRWRWILRHYLSRAPISSTNIFMLVL
jgi:hypothetical protein